jgi:hypothetical protein
MWSRWVLLWALAGLFVACARLAPGPTDPLPSWNAGSVKASIVDFVRRVTMQGGAEFVPPAARIAVFDNDGTLWSEQPMYFQLAFAIDRVRALAPQHPEWRTRQPFKAVLDGDLRALAASGDKGLVELLMVTHTARLDGADLRHSPGAGDRDHVRHPISDQQGRHAGADAPAQDRVPQRRAG